jgi:hypothetical protein
LSSYGWQELLYIMIIGFCGFPHIRSFKFLFLSLRCTVRSKNLIVSHNSFSIVNCIDGCSFLNLLSIYSKPILFWSHIMSSTYLKYAITSLSLSCWHTHSQRESFKKSFTTLKAYIHLFRDHVQCFELS